MKKPFKEIYLYFMQRRSVYNIFASLIIAYISGATLHGQANDLFRIEKIEILRGIGSVQHGSDAM